MRRQSARGTMPAMQDDHGLTHVVCEPATDGARSALTATLCVPSAHPVLAGHFPGAPLVPGVVLLDAVRCAAERALGQRLATVAVDDVRFASPLLPDVRAALIAEVRREGEEFRVSGQWARDGERLAAFVLRLAPRR